MKIKVRKSSNADLRRNLSRRKIELEAALIESQFSAIDIVNPAEAYLDPETGEMWLPLGMGSNVDVLTLPFRNEGELRLIRQRARITALKNPYAKNLLNSIAAFTVGKGHKYQVTPKKGINPDSSTMAKRVSKQVQKWLDALLRLNKWGKRQRQTVWRYHRDGEVFIRLFFQEDGFTLFRFVEPAEIFTPGHLSGEANCTFGIETDPEDVETPENYFINEDKVGAEEIQHRKANVDLNMKRGLSTLFTIREHLDRALKLLRNMSITVANQTAISTIRHHKATGKQVQSFAAKAAVASQYNKRTGKDQLQGSNPPGAVVDLVDGKTRYEFPAGGLNAASPVQVLSAELRAIASSMSWPEFMIGSDSSNANYSSTMVAENPAVKSIETEQSDHVADDLELLWAAVENAVNVGRLPPEALTLIEIEVESPIIVARNPKDKADTDQTLNTMRVKSPQTIAAECGLDYAQEQANFNEHDDLNLDAGALDGPVTGEAVPASDGDIAKTALNGAQVTALMAVLAQAAGGMIPVESVKPIIQASFPGLDDSTIDRIVTPLQGFKAKPAKPLAIAA